ncbi:hypothetical protein HOC01_02580 [archaeon]|jgi:hypothetical protein|nr:hypothetical protein [archaeon]MBT6697795.1 hypothetical protein [archaeon]
MGLEKKEKWFVINSKKGMTGSVLIGMMITLIAFVLVSGTLMRFMSESNDIAAEVLCHESNALRAQSAVRLESMGVDVEAKLAPSLCKNIVKKVSGERDEIMREFADSMASCWWMFGEGKYEELLHDTDINAFFDISNTENMCFNCYTILVDEKEIEGGYIAQEEFEEFLREETYSKSNTSYLDYLQSSGGPGRAIVTAPAIIPREAYSISFMPKNKESSSEFWFGVAETVGTVALVYVGVGVVVTGGVIAGACIVGTGGICAGGIAAAATAGEAVFIASSSLAVAKGGLIVGGVALGASAYTGSAAYNDLVDTVFDETERDVSTVSLNFLTIGEEKCGSEDIAGK